MNPEKKSSFAGPTVQKQRKKTTANSNWINILSPGAEPSPVHLLCLTNPGHSPTSKIHHKPLLLWSRKRAIPQPMSYSRTELQSVRKRLYTRRGWAVPFLHGLPACVCPHGPLIYTSPTITLTPRLIAGHRASGILGKPPPPLSDISLLCMTGERGKFRTALLLGQHNDSVHREIPQVLGHRLTCATEHTQKQVALTEVRYTENKLNTKYIINMWHTVLQ